MKKIKLGKVKSKDKIRLFSAETDVADISAAKISLCGNREATVEGCKSVVDYYDSHIKLNIGGLSICFIGSGLVIESFFDGNVIIKGKIEKIEYY